MDNIDGRLVIDLRNNPDCMPNGFNLSEACAGSAALIGIFNGIDDATVPTNEGSFRRVEIKLRENCALGIPRHPTSTSVATSNVTDRLIGAVQMALANLGEGFGMAEIGSCQTAAQAVVSGIDPRRGSPFVNQLIMGDTLGAASPFEDGWVVLISAGTAGLSMFDSIEVNELRHPLRVFSAAVAGGYRRGRKIYRGALVTSRIRSGGLRAASPLPERRVRQSTPGGARGIGRWWRAQLQTGVER